MRIVLVVEHATAHDLYHALRGKGPMPDPRVEIDGGVLHELLNETAAKDPRAVVEAANALVRKGLLPPVPKRVSALFRLDEGLGGAGVVLDTTQGGSPLCEMEVCTPWHEGPCPPPTETP